MNYIGYKLQTDGPWERWALKVDLIVRGVNHACLVGALGYVHIARRSHFKVR